MGVGSALAHVVFDDLYEHELSETNVYTGHKYYILKNGFFFQPTKVISQEVKNVLINFGHLKLLQTDANFLDLMSVLLPYIEP